ncbi:VapE domain-containing protein [Segatella copri]|uniref:Helicase n=1 Tax=Segatella copri TaxID=165179 RepID=A0A6G1VQX3_9BACT|nr:VapE domain-containing protein [Segatella copri]MQN60130.1 helicase [Segatella copri]MQP15800.1 helicase [Segatella copri]
MKVTIVHTNNKNQLLVSTKTMEKLMERFARDDSKLTINHFRESVPYLSNNYEGYKDMPKWMHIYPAAEFAKDDNNNLKMKAFNGILLLKFGNITDVDGVEGIKRSVAILPSTLAAITGADGKTVIVLIKFQGENDSLPTSEADAEHLYRIAYQQIFPVYQAIVKASILVDGPKPSIEAGSTLSQEPSIHNSFMMTLDAEPYFNGKAVAMKIDSHARSQSPAPSTDNHQLTIPDFKTPEEGKKVDKNSIRENIVNMMQLLESRYDFRYNTVMKFVEYMPKDKGWYGYQPVDPRVQKRMTLEVQLADIRVSIKDVRNFLESDYIKNYNPIDEYLFQCYDKWDGKDHIRALARTVPTANPHWADWFYTWFLGMVDQWRGYSHRQYGNSVAPLLISKQGYNKSTFCRRLLPPELQWGYSDNLILSEKRQVYQAMAQFMVINLDEFNQISPQVQQGFLKNLIQLPTLKYKPPYGSHVMEFPRLASFIATSNMKDILSDPSGNRRFIGVELTGPIDVSVRPNYQQLFAQALSALNNGEKSYFDAQQVKLIMKSNSQFEIIQPIDQYFLLYFELVEDEKEGDYLTAAEIFDYLKKQIGSSLKVNSLMGFGRKLANMSELKHKRFADGMKYLVKKK